MGALVVVTGCGTGIGKTHFAESLIWRLAGDGWRVGSYKPIETGIEPGAVEGADSRRLAGAAVFHVKQRYVFGPPVSPHLAARDVGVSIDLARIAADVKDSREQADAMVVELAGGLFSPLGQTTTNADLVTQLNPTLHVLIASNRLGVLHDVLAVTKTGVPLDLVLLMPAGIADLSQTSNATELRALGVPCLGALPFGPSKDLANDPILSEVVATLSARRALDG